MKLPLSWLKDFVPVKLSAEALAHRLTMGGFEIEEILDVGGEEVFEVNVTPNRGDCLSILGLAREVSAICGVPLRPFAPFGRQDQVRPANTRSLKVETPASVRVESKRKCPLYSMAFFSGVRVGPSPDWLVKRLEWAGLRSLNTIVDITNYVLMESGQPLHAFDLDKVAGARVVVRQARSGEKILALDGEEHELSHGDLVIADSEKPIAIAGIIGGRNTEIDEGTKAVALECAFFDPMSIRRTSRSLGIQTDSSYRFARGVDPEGVLRALERAASLIEEIAGGTPAGKVMEIREKKHPVFRVSGIPCNPAEIQTRLGGEWRIPQIRDVFKRLNLRIRAKGSSWEILPPSYRRGDLRISADLIEEVARLGGLDRIPVTFPPLKGTPRDQDPARVARRQAKSLLASLGLRETIHFSFLAPQEVAALDPSLLDSCIALGNPLSVEGSILRPSLLPSLLKTASFHHRHKMFSVRLFELKKRYYRDAGSPRERLTLAGLLGGARLSTHWSQKTEETDFYDVKGVLGRLLDSLKRPDIRFSPGRISFLHPSQQAVLQGQDKTVGVVGEVHPDVLERFDLKRRVFVFELDWEELVSARTGETCFSDYSRLPLVERDLALIVDEAIPADSLSEFIRSQDPSIGRVAPFDLYRGSQIPEGKKSLAFSVQLGLKDRTLTEEEINGIYGRVVENLKRHFGAEIR